MSPVAMYFKIFIELNVFLFVKANPKENVKKNFCSF